MDCVSHSFHTRQASLVVLEKTRAGKQAKHIACVDKCGAQMSVLQSSYINIIDSR